MNGSDNISLGTISYLTVTGTTYNAAFGSTTAGYALVGGRIRGSQIDIFSDKLLKKNITPVDTQRDLQTVLKIPLKRFDYIDEIQHRTKEHIGVIAQEIEQIPELKENVQVHPDFTPDFYRLVDIVEVDDGLFSIVGDMNYSTDTEIRFYYERNGNQVEAQGTIKNKHITHKQTKLNVSKIFLYGKRQDVKSVNYNSLYTHGLSAVQELYKIIKDQQEQIDELKTFVKKLSKYSYTPGQI